VSFSEV